MTNTTYYPMPNASTPVEMMQYANSLTNELFGIFILVGLWWIIFISQKNYPTPRAFATASFTSAIASYFLFLMDMVPVIAIFATTVMVIVSVFFQDTGRSL